MKYSSIKETLNSGFATTFAYILFGAVASAAVQYPAQTPLQLGSCGFSGSTAGFRIQTRADDFRAMKDQARLQNWVVNQVPVIPTPQAPFRMVRAAASLTVGPCGGIDDCVQQQAGAASIPFAPLTSDLEFLRRARLDLTGRIPTADEVLEFLADSSPNKRSALVDRLLNSPEWVHRWVLFLGDLFENTHRNGQFQAYAQGRDSFHLYMLESLSEEKPYDQMVREMLAATGYTDGRNHPEKYPDAATFRELYRDFENNPVRASAVTYVSNGYRRGGPREDTFDSITSRASRHFLGISAMECVLCHDGAGHLDALNLWGAQALRLEGWSLSSFFSRLSGPRKPAKKDRPKKGNGRAFNVQYYILKDLPEGQAGPGEEETGYYRAQTKGGNRPHRTHHEKYVKAQYPFESYGPVDGSLPLRQQLGYYITGDPQFARATVNYIWKEFFTRGIVEPVDGFDLLRLEPSTALPGGWTVQPSHPHLLQWLADGFRDSGFSLKWLMREIATSKTYQLSSRYDGAYSPSYDQYFVRHAVKPLTAEQMHDAITVATDLPGRYEFPKFLRRTVSYAGQFADTKNMPAGNARVRQFLDAFNRGNRADVVRSSAVSSLQALNLMNNPFILDRMDAKSPGGTLQHVLGLTSDREIVQQLFIRFLGRLPTGEEAVRASASLQGGARGERVADLMWTLVNKTEFFFNY